MAAGAALGEVDLVPSWPAHGWLALLALTSQVLGWMLISVSLPRLPAALTSVLLLVSGAHGAAFQRCQDLLFHLFDRREL